MCPLKAIIVSIIMTRSAFRNCRKKVENFLKNRDEVGILLKEGLEG
jgi:hypothetical protein